MLRVFFYLESMPTSLFCGLHETQLTLNILFQFKRRQSPLRAIYKIFRNLHNPEWSSCFVFDVSFSNLSIAPGEKTLVHLFIQEERIGVCVPFVDEDQSQQHLLLLTLF